MQENSAPNDTFLHRTDQLAARMGLNVQDLPRILGISRRTLFKCRSAESEVTTKSRAKLEAAERQVEQLTERARSPDETATMYGNLNEPNAEYGGKKRETFEERALDVLERIARSLETIATQNHETKSSNLRGGRHDPESESWL